MIDDEQQQDEHEPNAGEPEAGTELANDGGQESPRPDAVDPALASKLEEMRTEADEIAGLGTGDEQVERAERFVEAAGSFDEQLGAAARSESHSE